MYIRKTKENSDKIAEEARIKKRMEENTLQLKLRNAVQSDEQTKINKYAEGWCYGCARMDQILTTVYNVCRKDIDKRGSKGILAPPRRKYIMELCDFCGHWSTTTFQVNCALCGRCQRKVHVIHQKYREGGGQYGQNPYFKMLQRKYGKDWLLYTMPHLRRI